MKIGFSFIGGFSLRDKMFNNDVAIKAIRKFLSERTPNPFKNNCFSYLQLNSIYQDNFKEKECQKSEISHRLCNGVPA